MAMKNPTKTYRLALIGVMTAILCILGPLSIPLPFSPVPLSLTNFAILCDRRQRQMCIRDRPGAIWSAFYCWL